MSAKRIRTAGAMLATVVFIVTAQAQNACVNDAPNPYNMVKDWYVAPRPFGSMNSVSVDANDNIWAADRCQNGCTESDDAPVWEFSPDGKVLQNFGAGIFAEPHGLYVDSDGNVWVVDVGGFGGPQNKSGKGMQVTKFSPDGKVLMTLGKTSPSGTGLDVLYQPTSVVVTRNGNIFVTVGHRSAENNPTPSVPMAPNAGYGDSRIVEFDKDGKFVKTFGHLGSADGELLEPHAITVDSRGRLFVADRKNNRVEIFDQDGKFIAAWKQFGRPSGVWVDKNDVLYVVDDMSEDSPGFDTVSYPANPGCRRGIRIGSARTGKVDYFIPMPAFPPRRDSGRSPRFIGEASRTDYDHTSCIEGITVDSHGVIYGAATEDKTIYKFVKKVE
jgi:streptogramin lyase